MSTKELAINAINVMTDSQFEEIIDMVYEKLDRCTLAKIESAFLKANPNPKTYNSFKEFEEEFENE